jgi:DNA adenine methylase
MAKPFVKWAGGKRQLLSALKPLFPKALLAGQLTEYAEPFLGGGAMFFFLAELGLGLKKAYLNDANPELSMTYRVVQHKVEDLILELTRIENKYLAMREEARLAYYLDQRVVFNRDRAAFPYQNLNSDAIMRSAQFLFFNRTGFNGLWRVNSSGSFNVPFGKYANPRICDLDGLRSAALALRDLKAEITTGDFGFVKEAASKKTFVYYDPPYRPLTSSAAFTQYTAGGFDDGEQKRLAQLYAELSKAGICQMLSNSDPHNTDPTDDFFSPLYLNQGTTLHRIKARRSINSKSTGRGEIDEIVIVNYPVP